MKHSIKNALSKTFSALSKASARKKIYSHIAAKKQNKKASILLRAVAEAESVQSKRLFNSLRGQIDTSDTYLETIFEIEIPKIIKGYENALQELHDGNDKSVSQIFSQLLRAEKRILSLYSKETKTLKIQNESSYFVCQFCGFLAPKNPPDSCPICGAASTGFKEVR